MTERTGAMNQKEAKRWQNITPTVTCYLKAVIYRTHRYLIMNWLQRERFNKVYRLLAFATPSFVSKILKNLDIPELAL